MTESNAPRCHRRLATAGPGQEMLARRLTPGPKISYVTELL